MKKVSRRDFLKGIGTGGALSVVGTITPGSSEKGAQPLKTDGATQTTTICPYCGVGCGIVVSVKDGKVIGTEGDYEHPINQGALCSKGAALRQVGPDNPLRLSKVLYRAPGSDKWEEKSSEWAVSELAKRIKESRDKSFIAQADGITVNRTEKVASIGAAALDNEEGYLISKLMRSLGITYLEHQARMCHSSTVTSLAASFGRGAMTNHWIDIKNADVVFVCGANPAENHPASFRWITKAQESGGKLVVADPRFTRSASKADYYVAHRPGTDIALIGGMINYALQNNLYFADYVKNYTNAACIVTKDYAFNDGLFSAYDAEKRSYDGKMWDFEKAGDKVKKDMTLQNPRTVFQLMKEFYSRYTPEKVSEITGVPKAELIKLYDIYCSTGKPDKAGTILYAMGATQHTVGVQYIRSYAIIQLLLGNIGIPGGGINAMRGESNVQGSSDMGVLTNTLPGYNPSPTQKDHATWKDYCDKEVPKTSYWSNRPKFVISMLKAWYGDKATKENDFCYNWLPKSGKGFKGQGYTMVPLMEAVKAGDIDGLMIWGANSAVSHPDATTIVDGLGKLKWMAAFDIWETDTSVFWKGPGVDTKAVQTEVFLFPCASSIEKEGSVANSGRWIQWRYAAVPAPGQAKADLQWLNLLGLELKKLYKAGGAFPDPIVNLVWNYGEEADPHKVMKELNGYDIATGAQLKNFTKLLDDGTTACGCWIYGGTYPGPDKKDNACAKRGKEDPTGLGLFPNWAFAWPVNRRIIYNRCSMDPSGKPWNAAKGTIWWDETKKDWVRNDVPDFGWKDAKTEAIKPPKDSAAAPFLMNPSGLGHLFSAAGKAKDGPFPEHYEPFESPVRNSMNSQQVNPACALWEKKPLVASEEFPIVATTMRLTNHWQAGAMTRNVPWLAEIAPEMYVEMSEELAAAKGIKNNEWVKVVSARGSVNAKAMVTSRIKPFNVGGKSVEVVAMPFHFGFNGYVTGGPDKGKSYAANQVTHKVGDANTRIPEYKAFLVNIVKA